jgi:hypothetical protein
MGASGAPHYISKRGETTCLKRENDKTTRTKKRPAHRAGLKLTG